jgi:TonB family protein
LVDAYRGTAVLGDTTFWFCVRGHPSVESRTKEMGGLANAFIADQSSLKVTFSASSNLIGCPGGRSFRKRRFRELEAGENVRLKLGTAETIDPATFHEIRGVRMRTLHLLVICGVTAGTTALQAQEVRSQEEIASHLMTWVAPVYPAISQAAQVQGDVVFKVELAPDGLLRSMKIVSGPPMLRKATADALKQWRYQPFHDGNAAIAVTGDVLVRFSLADKPAVHTPPRINGKWQLVYYCYFPAAG